MPRFVEPVLAPAPSRAILRVVQRTVIALALVGCGEAPATGLVAELAPEQAPTVLSRIACVANARERSLSCGSDVATSAQLARSIATLPGAATPDIILGGQNSYVKMTSSNVVYAGEVFSFDATVTNLLDQKLGTTNGVSVDPNGIRVFFENPPQRLTGSGTVDYTNPAGGGSLVDGFATFTQSNQAFYRYDEILSTNQTSAARNWKLHVPSTVGSFQFFVYVSAPVQYPQGSLRTVMLQEPIGGVTGETFSTPIAVKVVSATGVTQTGFTGQAHVALVTGSGALSGTTTRPVINGVATFDDLRVVGTGTFRLGFGADATSPVLSQPFDLTAASSPGISFHSITATGAPGAPLNLSAVAGQLDVSVSVQGTAGYADLFLATGGWCAENAVGGGDIHVASTSTTAGSSIVTMTVNTAHLVTGAVPRFLNGNYCLKARLHETSTDSYADLLPLTLSNSNTFIADIAFSGPSGLGFNGLQYNSGDLTVTVTPVNYAPAAAIAAMSVALGSAPLTLALTPVASTLSFRGVYSSTTASPNAITQHQTIPAIGDRLIVSSAVNTNGVPVSHNDSLAMLRIDNASPNAPSLKQGGGYGIFGPCAQPHGLPCTDYVAGSFVFATSANSGFDVAANSPTTAIFGVRANDAGYVPLDPAGGITAAACTTAGWTILADASSLPNTPVAQFASAHRLRRFETDALGNVRCFDYPSPFGVDRDVPTLFMTDGALSGSVVGQNATHSYMAMDSTSGFVLGHVVDINILRNFVTCVNPTGATGSVTVDATMGNGCIAQTTGSGINITPGGEGYHTVTARAVDRAANRSAPIVNTVLYDVTAPTLTGVSVPPTLTGGTAVSFGSSATDNVDLKAAGMTLQYSTVALAYPADNFGPNFDAARMTSSAVVGTASFFMKQLQSVNGSSAPNPVSASDVAQSVALRVVDAANHASAPSTAGIASGITASSGFSTNDFDTFQLTATPQTLSNGPGGGVRQASLVASATLNDPLAQQAPLPFSMVCFYYQINAAEGAFNSLFAAGTYQTIGCVNAPSILDAAGEFRRFDYTLPAFDPPSSLGTSGSVNIIAIGARANGEGIVSNASTAITLIP